MTKQYQCWNEHPFESTQLLKRLLKGWLNIKMSRQLRMLAKMLLNWWRMILIRIAITWISPSQSTWKSCLATLIKANGCIYLTSETLCKSRLWQFMTCTVTKKSMLNSAETQSLRRSATWPSRTSAFQLNLDSWSVLKRSCPLIRSR